ncbi:MAG: hypothetical protein ACK5MV_07580 [Aminipila sp.]
MKIPENIRIGGVDYKVELQGALNDGVNMLYGQIDYQASEIKLNDDIEGHQHQCITLWHEVLHGIVNNFGMEIEDEEKIVDMFAKGIYQVLQDNGAVLFDLRKEDA